MMRYCTYVISYLVKYQTVSYRTIPYYISTMLSV